MTPPRCSKTLMSARSGSFWKRMRPRCWICRMLPPHKVTHRRQDAKSESVSTSIESESLSQDASRLSDRIAAGLREQILSGRLKPGSRIGQEALAAEFKVSRLPVRDALGVSRVKGSLCFVPTAGRGSPSLICGMYRTLPDTRATGAPSVVSVGGAYA